MTNSLIVYVVLVIFVATLIRSTLGFGEALVAVPLLALRTPVALAVPLAVLVSIVVAAAIVLQDWRHIDVRSVAGLVATTLVGIPLGLLLLTRVNDREVKLLLGAIIIAFASYSLVARRHQPAEGDDGPWLIACGFLAGVLGGAYGMNGPPLVVYGLRRGWTPQRFRATLQGYFLPASLAGMIGYARLGLWRSGVTTAFAWSLPGVLLALFVGGAINDRLPIAAFRRLVHVGLIFTGAALAVQAVLAASPGVVANPSTVGRTPFVLDGNRVYAELGFARPDGSVHRALAFVDMGSPAMTIRESLLKELAPDRGGHVRFTVGDVSVQVDANEVTADPRPPSSVGSDLKVEATLPAAMLQRYQVVIDYAERVLVLAPPGQLKPEGVATPFETNPRTGLIAVHASIAGQRYAITIDNGSAYTWVTDRVAAPWMAKHHNWVRGVGAVGPSNMMMSSDDTETSGVLLRLPEIAIGSLELTNVGMLAAGRSRLIPGYANLFDWYSQKNAVPVIGWIGGNVLRNFRITIDYGRHTMYWARQRQPDVNDLDQVGVTLRSENGRFFVAAIATRDGTPTVTGIRPGDELIRVGDLDLGTASWGRVFDALHGAPGEPRLLTVERQGTTFTVSARVTRF